MKTILLSLLACLLIVAGFDLGAGRIRFGDATLNDSTSSLVTMNKGLKVNGALRTGDSLTADGVILTDYSGITWDGANDLVVSGEAGALVVRGSSTHAIYTGSGTNLLSIDSTTGIEYRIENMGGIWSGTSRVGQKLIRGVAPTGNSTVTFAHGITDGKILSADIWLRHDTTATSAYHTAANWYVQPGASYDPTILYYGGFDGTYCWARFPVAATATRGDSLYFLLTYIK